MMEADVNAQVAWATVSSLTREGAISQKVNTYFPLLGSAYMAYSTVLAADDSPSRNTATGEIYEVLHSSF